MRGFTQSLIIFLVILFKADCHSETSEQRVCRALSLRGGGTKGAYEIGVLRGFIENLPPEEVAYDVVVGASVGAFNAASLALYEKGNEKEALAYLEEFWLNNMCQDSWDFWESYLIAGFFKSSFLNDSKIIEQCHHRFDNRQFKRNVTFHAIDIKTGTVVVFDEDVPREFRALAVKSAGSIPGFFTPVKLGEFELVDGFLYDKLDITEAIHKCKVKGYKDEEIVVDVILCLNRPVQLEKWSFEEARRQTVLDMGARQKQIKDYNLFLKDLQWIVNGFPKVKLRYIVQPSEQLPAMIIPIYSKLEDIQFQLELGRKDAENIIRNGQYSNIDHINRILEDRNQ